jgi:hypothetical protein
MVAGGWTVTSTAIGELGRTALWLLMLEDLSVNY